MVSDRLDEHARSPEASHIRERHRAYRAAIVGGPKASPTYLGECELGALGAMRSLAQET
jgi:hypothetical protein